MTVADTKSRIAWVDYAKGICIILVVGMHSTLGVEKAADALSGLHNFIEWARPFRMPDFFMISGLFLASRVDRPWRGYLDSKVIHFAYFYLLWMALQFLVRGYGFYQEGGWSEVAQQFAYALVEPFSTLWFIYLLGVFFIAAKVLRNVPPLLVFAGAAILEIMTRTPIIDRIHEAVGEHILIDETAGRFVYFYAGYWLAPRIFALADRVNTLLPWQILSGLVAWGAFNYVFVAGGYSKLPLISLALGFIGACAVISTGVLLSKFKFANALRYCGENSIVIYLAFFLFMAPARALLLRLFPQGNLTLISMITTSVAVIGPLILFWATRETRLHFLFKRPTWARLADRGPWWHTAAHVQTPALKAHAR